MPYAGAKGERKYSSYALLTSALDGIEWSPSRPSCAGKRIPTTHWIGGSVGLRSSLDTKVTGKILGLGVGSGFIALMMEAICASETSVYSNETTRHYIPEDSKLKRFHSCLKTFRAVTPHLNN
jgi:hypothetical protein